VLGRRAEAHHGQPGSGVMCAGQRRAAQPDAADDGLASGEGLSCAGVDRGNGRRRHCTLQRRLLARVRGAQIVRCAPGTVAPACVAPRLVTGGPFPSLSSGARRCRRRWASLPCGSARAALHSAAAPPFPRSAAARPRPPRRGCPGCPRGMEGARLARRFRQGAPAQHPCACSLQNI
jgi:hypothetical protein